MRLVLILPLAAGLAGCQGGPHQELGAPVRRSASMDSATTQRLCAKPDSVLAGQRDCELRDQSPPGPRRLP
jgi:hypothetical protein